MKATAIIAMACLLCACSPEPTKTEAQDAQKLVDAMTYAKAKNGLCFGVATVERLDSALRVAVNVIAVQVDCKAVGL